MRALEYLGGTLLMCGWAVLCVTIGDALSSAPSAIDPFSLCLGVSFCRISMAPHA